MSLASPEDVTERLMRSHTRLRHVEQPEYPWPAILARADDGVDLLLVDVGAFALDWSWTASTTGHIVTPLDVLRSHSGQLVALPVCTETLSSFLERRRRSVTSLSAGEGVTILVSVLRGTLESLKVGGIDATGVWWLTDTGRPAVVPGGARRLLDIAAELVTLTSEITADRALVTESNDFTRVLCGHEVLEAHADELETALFARAAAQPLATAGMRAVATFDAQGLDVGVRETENAGRTSLSSWAATLTPHIDSGVRDLFESVLTQLRLRRTQRRQEVKPPRRRNVWIWAVGLAVALLAAGLAWPTDADPHESPAVETASAATPAQSQSPMPARDEDPVAALGALLTARNQCRQDDGGCLDELMLDPSTPIPEGAIDLPRDEIELMLIDDYGGAASVGIRPRGEQTNSQIAVVVQTEKTWVLREVFTVAQHP
ncbi:hypothetical protein FHX49_002554 [Microbacterium endophyticum]|uniref:Uncharacterized protein n=1 Tax=Microbacterium endophyticum TaxID=1526412 RepID=A0A7W4V514_9MICO|nr:hypothetical protein [Microbacterium endophyticum]MBB2976962.1 hypothetical protein [Microbacterium endophyticum]NIK36752.1 hypothetical protein [Microbacterium endophyticum]